MKAHRGFVWYLFAIYVASVWVAYKSFQTLHSQPNKLSSASLYRSSSSPPSIRSLSLIRCVIFSDLNVKYETKDCKPLMQNLRKQLSETLTKVASNPVVSMAVASWIVPETTKKTGKSGNKFPNNENRTTFVMATIQQLIRKIARRESEHLVRYFGIVTLLVAIVLALVLAPLSTCSHAVYIITILTFSLFVIFYFGLLLRSFVHHSIRLFTWNRYHFWVLPNLSEDVGFTASFWPIYTLERTSNTISKTIGTGSSQSLSEKDLAVTRTESQFEDVPLDTTDSETKSDDELSINHSESEHTSSNKSTDSNEQVNAEKRNGKTCSSSSDYSLSSSISSCSSQCSSNQATTKNDSFERLLRKSHSTPDYRIGFGSVCTKPPATIEAHSLTFDRRMAITKSLTIPANVLRECKQLLRSKIEPKRTVKVDKPALETSSDEFEILNETDVLKEIRN